MNRLLFSFAVFAALYCFSPEANSKELIRVFKGSESRTTAEFVVKAPWIVDWMTTGDYPGTMGLQVDLVSSPGGEYVGKIVMTKWVDNGVRLLNEGGRFRFQVYANLINWTLRVEQLNRLEAEAYTPKNQD